MATSERQAARRASTCMHGRRLLRRLPRALPSGSVLQLSPTHRLPLPTPALLPAAPSSSTPSPAARSSCWARTASMTAQTPSAEVRREEGEGGACRRAWPCGRQARTPPGARPCWPATPFYMGWSVVHGLTSISLPRLLRSVHPLAPAPAPAAQTTSPNEDIFLVGGHTAAERYVSASPLGQGAGAPGLRACRGLQLQASRALRVTWTTTQLHPEQFPPGPHTAVPPLFTQHQDCE